MASYFTALPPALTATTRRPASGVPLEELLDDELLEDDVVEEEELVEDEPVEVELLDDELLEELLEEELLDELFGDPFPPQPSRDRDKSAHMAKRARVRRWFLSLINIKHRIIFIDDSFNPFEFKKVRKSFSASCHNGVCVRLLFRVLLDVVHQPGHSRTLCSVFLNQAGTGDPSSVNHITPDGDALHVRVVVEHREVLLEIPELILVVGVTDIVFRDIDGHLQLVPQIVDRLLHG
jgi:hypothetical protein